MHMFDAHAADVVLGYVRERLELDEAPLDFPGADAQLKGALAGLINEQGTDIDEVLKRYDEILSRAVISADSPRYLAFIPAAPSKAALLFDTVVSCASLQGISWLEAAGAIAAENQVLRWIADLAGMPASAGGVFVQGGSAGNLSALAVARDEGRRRLGDPRARVRIAVSGQTHSSVHNALHLLDVEPFEVPVVDHRLTGEALAAALAQDSNPQTVVAVASTAGTTNAGIIDDLAGLAQVCKDRGMWLHVDGAYGGAGLLVDSERPRYSGIEHADSFIVDPHKWLFAPFDSCALLYRDPAAARRVHSQEASYLDVIHTEDEWNPSDYAHHLTRRARGLPLWFSLCVNGVAAYRAAVTAGVKLAQQAAAEISASEHMELVREPGLSIVLWRRHGWGLAEYQNLQDRLLAAQTAFVTPTSWQGETVGRFAFIHPNTTLDMVREVIDACR
jgi:glutamate/tyrosine decarboxylase-like PLP-dependent enzyme